MKNSNKRRKKKKDNPGIVFMTIPTLLWYIAFCFIPMFGIILAFKSYRLIPGKRFFYSLLQSEWIGFENFRFLFLNPQLKLVLRNTIGYNSIFLVMDTVLPVAFAIGCSYLYSNKLSGLAQTASLLPYYLSWVAVSYFAFSLLSFDKGIFNQILERLGKNAVRWYQQPEVWPAILIFTHIWKNLGYSAIIYRTFLSGVDPCQYESALMDGATPWQMIRNITLPYLIPVAVALLILNLGSLFASSFGLFYQVTRNSASILETTETIDVYVYKALKENANYGYSAATSLLQNICGCFLMLVSNIAITKYDPERGLFR